MVILRLNLLANSRQADAVAGGIVTFLFRSATIDTHSLQAPGAIVGILGGCRLARAGVFARPRDPPQSVAAIAKIEQKPARRSRRCPNQTLTSIELLSGLDDSKSALRDQATALVASQGKRADGDEIACRVVGEFQAGAAVYGFADGSAVRIHRRLN